MAKKKMSEKAALAKLKKCSKEVERLSDLKYKAKEKRLEALDAYAASIADEVAELLKSLKWDLAKGRGSLGMLRALLPKKHRLIKIQQALADYGDWGWRQACGKITLNFGRNYTGMHVDVSREELKAIGIELRKQKANVDRREMLKLLKRKGVTPEQLKAMLDAEEV